MKYTKRFREVDGEDIEMVGGKGVSLGKMINSGINVPDGFVVLSLAFDSFIRETGLIQKIDYILNHLNHEATHEIESASENICSLILSKDMPYYIKEEIYKCFQELGVDFVAIRSSATKEDGTEDTWAGQLGSYLNIREENLVESIKKCWASLFTPRAIFYRLEKKLDKSKISMAVVIEKMIQSEISGVAFSVHPVTEDRNQLIIEAGFGLGEAIVSGLVTPDLYVVDKETGNILNINTNGQTKALYCKDDGGIEWRELTEEKIKPEIMNEDQILILAQLIMKLEGYCGFPCDIEWAYKDGKFYILQSRPITTLGMKARKENDK